MNTNMSKLKQGMMNIISYQRNAQRGESVSSHSTVGRLRQALLALLLLTTGAGSAWADTWDGNITNNAKDKFAENGIVLKNSGETNSSTNPYLIKDAKGFAYFMRIVHEKWTGYSSDYYWQLNEDINLNNIVWSHGSNSGNSFQGHFDGGGHTISNLKLEVNAKSNFGLFPTIQGASTSSLAEVKNLKISGVTFTSANEQGSTTRLGALTGYAKQANISNITINDVTFTYTGGISAENDLGGVIGATDAATTVNNVTVSGVTATFTGTTTNLYVAGLIGKINNQTAVTNCSTSSVSITYNDIANASRISGLIGYAQGTSATAQTIINKCSVSGTKIQLTKGINNGSFIGALLAQGGKSTVLSDSDGTDENKNTVTSPIINIGGEIKGTSYIGGAFGDFAGGASNTSIINKLDVTTPSVTVNKMSVKDCYIGGVFGRINTYTDVKAVNITTKTTDNTLEYKATDNTNFNLYLGTFAGGVTGTAAQKTLVSDIDITGDAQLTIGTGSNNANQIKAGLIGQVTTHVDLSDLDVANSKITVKGNLAAASNIGGIVGYTTSGDNAPVTIDDVTLTGTTSVNVTGNVTTANNLIGSAFGNIQGKATTATTTVSNITIPTATLTFGTNTSNSTIGAKAGLVGQITTNVNINTWTITNNTVTVNGDIKTTAANIGGFVGYATTAANGPVSISRVTFSGTNAVNITGKVSIASMIGGFAGYLKSGKSATALNAELEVTGNTLGTTNVTVGNDANADNTSVGGFVGQMEAARISQSDVTAANISINGNLTNNIYVGGLVGQLVQSTFNSIVERCHVSGSIQTASGKTFAKAKNFAFGGIVGYAPHSAPSATAAAKISTVQNCVSEVNIDLSSLKPVSGSISGEKYNFKKHGLVAGGVIGMMNAPVQLPENLFYSGQINAPLAVVAPVVGTFLSNIDTEAYVYDDYAGISAQYITPAEWEKASTWYYNGYKIGLSSDVTSQTARTKNYKDTQVAGGYLTVDNTTFGTNNSITGLDKLSRTVLAYNVSNKDQNYGIFPKWSTDAATYPKYYMYYMQGVNRGQFVLDTKVEALKTDILDGVGMLIDMTLEDLNGDATVNANRGLIEHTLKVTTTADDVTYRWYVNGISKSTNAEFQVTPDFDGVSITVEGIKAGKVAKRLYYNIRPVLRVKDPTATIYGTKDNPYLIGTATDMQLLSNLSTIPNNVVWERTYKSSDHYNRAYYELENDIDMSGITDFTPIGFPKSNDTGGVVSGYHQNFVFDGIFDGKGHTIRGLKETWHAGALNTNDQNMGWGLFAAVGNSGAQKKVGESVASQAIIRNLVIDGAVLKHKTDNTSFYYNNGTSGNANNCMVGVLAGIVSCNTLIQNIEIRNSKITDEGSSEYKLATRGLYVGGAIGSLQKEFKSTGDLPANTQIQHVAAHVDITLNKAAFTCGDADKKPAEMGQFNVGGIVGRAVATNATLAQMQGVMPKYTLYSGTVDAPKAWISPVVAAVRAKEQNGNDWKNYSKQWEGNNASAATQISVTNAQYYNFTIGSTLITDVVPNNKCGLGGRTMSVHSDGYDAPITYDALKYQGVNYGARNIAEKGVSLGLLNTERVDGYSFVWDETGTFVHLTTDPYIDLTLNRLNNNFTAEMEGAAVAPATYTWKVSFDGENWHNIEGQTSDKYTVPVSLKTKYVKATTTVDAKEYTSVIEIVDADKDLLAPAITKSESGDNAVFTFNLNPKSSVPAGQLTPSYVWYKTKEEAISPAQTGQTLTLAKDVFSAAPYNGSVWCKTKVYELGEEIAEYFIIYGATVVYVNGNNYSEHGAQPGNDENTGRTPDSPVLTIDKANKLLKSEADGGTVDNNIIVVMGTLNPNPTPQDKASYVPFQSRGSNPATLTGKYENVDYEGKIIIAQWNPNNSTDDSKTKQGGEENGVNPVNSETIKKGANCYVLHDTKFENLIFEANRSSGDGAGNNFIELHGNDVTFGKGLVMSGFQKLSKSHGNFNEAEIIPELTIILTATNLNQDAIDAYTKDREKPQVVTFQSGHYGRLMGGRYTNGFFAKDTNTSHCILASADNPIWAVVNIDIDGDNEMTDGASITYTRDINSVIAGLTDGSMYGDYTINVHGGNVSYIVGANQGNPVPNGNLTFTPKDGTPGAFGQWPNATYFGRTVINVEQDTRCKNINVGNLYAGGLGREANGDKATSIVDMYFYGRTEVNVKSGTVGSVYAGGAGGVFGVNPWDAHLPYATSTDDTDVDHAIINKVQYGDTSYGSWSNMVRGTNALATVKLHNLNSTGDGYSSEDLDLGNSYTTVNISGGTINGNVYGGGYGYVADMPFEVTMQGVGSVFGTTNVNISGNPSIGGSVYGGSQGHVQFYNKKNKYGQTINHIAEMNGTVNMRISGNPSIGGDIFGAGQGIESVGGEDYVRIATTGNNDLGSQYKSTINVIIDLPDTSILKSNIFGGGRMGAVDGDINIVINGGQINGNVYGGGMGEKGHIDKARVNGTTNVIVGN